MVKRYSLRMAPIHRGSEPTSFTKKGISGMMVPRPITAPGRVAELQVWRQIYGVRFITCHGVRFITQKPKTVAR